MTALVKLKVSGSNPTSGIHVVTPALLLYPLDRRVLCFARIKPRPFSCTHISTWLPEVGNYVTCEVRVGPSSSRNSSCIFRLALTNITMFSLETLRKQTCASTDPLTEQTCCYGPEFNPRWKRCTFDLLCFTEAVPHMGQRELCVHKT